MPTSPNEASCGLFVREAGGRDKPTTRRNAEPRSDTTRESNREKRAGRIDGAGKYQSRFPESVESPQAGTKDRAGIPGNNLFWPAEPGDIRRRKIRDRGLRCDGLSRK